jgi:hypothetical protein
MGRKAVPIDLDPGNLQWLQGRLLATGRRDLSEMINDLVAQARCQASEAVSNVQSIVGQVQISEEDPELLDADAAVRALFKTSQRRFDAV